MKPISATCLLLLLVSPLIAAQWPYPYPGAPTGGLPQPVGLSISTSQDVDGYYLTITTPGHDPATTEVTIGGHMITIRQMSGDSPGISSRSNSSIGPNSRSYSYSYSSGGSQATRSLSLPPDADPAGAIREDKTGEILVFIPRLKQ